MTKIFKRLLASLLAVLMLVPAFGVFASADKIAAFLSLKSKKPRLPQIKLQQP